MPGRSIKQERAHETRGRILVGAAHSFAEHGFAGATVSDIMARSGVTKGALYFHFDTKEEVADAVLAAHAESLTASVAGLSGSPAQKLIDFGYLAADGLASDPIFQATARLAVERETYGPDRPSSFGLWEDIMHTMLDEIDAAGCLRAGLDKKVVARMLSASMLGLHLSARATNPEATLHREIEAFWHITGTSFVTPATFTNLDLHPGIRAVTS